LAHMAPDRLARESRPGVGRGARACVTGADTDTDTYTITVTVTVTVTVGHAHVASGGSRGRPHCRAIGWRRAGYSCAPVRHRPISGLGVAKGVLLIGIGRRPHGLRAIGQKTPRSPAKR
jgi:hypothetical protein